MVVNGFILGVMFLFFCIVYWLRWKIIDPVVKSAKKYNEIQRYKKEGYVPSLSEMLKAQKNFTLFCMVKSIRFSYRGVSILSTLQKYTMEIINVARTERIKEDSEG